LEDDDQFDYESIIKSEEAANDINKSHIGFESFSLSKENNPFENKRKVSF
jgi:hypothetical protein